ncbi:MAG: 3-hydroxyacyl-ACP dehydratase FabZ family protein [Planctomycetia bacterium]|nr:3-hydroxyacyl-ACP dehydratase FabZ family protein [Planctomycetia bacterium]
MRFILIDKIKEIIPGDSITTTKSLSIAEEYLADHFPGFAVLPGVLMLEAMTQSAAWLIRITDNFKNSVITLKEAKNVKYIHFVTPGETLTIYVSLIDHSENLTKVKAEGYVGEKLALSAKLIMKSMNIADEDPVKAWKDKELTEEMKKIYSLLTQ